jgi:hypothetical protein
MGALLPAACPDGLPSGPCPFTFVSSLDGSFPFLPLAEAHAEATGRNGGAVRGIQSAIGAGQAVGPSGAAALGSSLVDISSRLLPGVYRGRGDPRVRCFEQGGEAATADGQPDKYLCSRINRRRFSMGVSDCRRPGHKRGVVTTFSEGASSRLGLYAEECKAVYPFMGTLTVDGEYSSDPKDFRDAKDRYLTWFMRKQKELCPPGEADQQSILWWVEFQKRGAPHLHFFYSTRVPWEEAAMKWQEICLRFGLATRDDFWRSATKFEKVRYGWRGVASYARKYASKQEQKIPLREVYDWQGRFWGVRGFKETESVKVTRTTDEAFACPLMVPAWKDLEVLVESAVDAGKLRRFKWPSPGTGATYFPVGGWEKHPELYHAIESLMAAVAYGAQS